MNIERKEVVLKFKERPREKTGLGGQYPHVVGNKIYYQLCAPTEIAYAIKEKDKYIKPSKNVIFTKSLAAQNFRIFIDDNPSTSAKEKYKAVGGYHCGMGYVKNPSIHGELKDCPISKKLPVIEYPNPVWPDRKKLLFKDDFYHPRHANGLYVFVSHDGLNWKEYHNKPIFSILTTCIDQTGNKLPDAILGLDFMPSIFFDKNINEYVIYLRANIALGCRYVLYSHSKDLINWSTPRLISCTPEFDIDNKQNFYYPAIYPFNDQYIAFPPHFKNTILDKNGHNRLYEEEYTPIMISLDGLNWETKDVILECKTGKHLHQPHVVSFRKESNKHVIYVHEGFQTANNQLVKYEIELGEVK